MPVNRDIESDDITQELVITGPQRDRLFERFARLYRGRADIVVVKDRRQDDRRERERRSAGSRQPSAGSHQSSGDRRGPDRRRRATWLFPPD